MSKTNKPKIKEIFKEDFLDGNSYSSRTYPELTSTVYKIRHSHYCVHCNNVAMPIQGNIEQFEDYSNTGYRCNCDAAILEMIEQTAHAMGDFKYISPPASYNVNRESYIDFISKHLGSRDLPLDGDKRSLSNLAISIERPNESNYLNFWPNNKRNISFYLSDKYYAFKDIYLFMSKVQERLLELKKEEDIEINKLLKKNSEKDFGFFS